MASGNTLKISLSPSKGAFFSFRAYADGKLVIDTTGGAGDYHGAAQNIEIRVVGSKGSTFAWSVKGTKNDGTPIDRADTATLDDNGDFDESI